MNHRIKEVRCALGLTQDEFGRRLGVGRGVITNIEFEKTVPKDAFVDLVCKEFNVSKEWLRDGVGEMFLHRTRNQELAIWFNSVLAESDDSIRKRMIAALSSLSTDEWEIVEKFAKKMTEGR